MTKFIGGILLATLLSKSTVMSVDVFAYEFLKAQSNIIAIVMYIQDDVKSESELISEVEDMMADISSNNFNINKLLKAKNDILGKIQTNMSLKARSKMTMTEEQIASFQRFYTDYSAKSDEVNEILSEIEQKLVLKQSKSELMSHETDYNTVVEELRSICSCQYDAILTLSSIIELGEYTLSVI